MSFLGEWKYCGDCGRQMRMVDRTCSMCMWEDPNADGATVAKPGGCAYELNGVRCPLPGVWSPSVTAKGPVFCTVHASERHYDAAAADELQRIIANPRQFLNFDPWREEMVRDIMAQHPEWNREPHETRSEYRTRMMGIARGLMGQVMRKMTTPSTPVQREPGGADSPHAAAPSSRPAPSISKRDLIDDAMEHIGELTAKLEEEGYATEIAQRMAFELALEQRLGA